jgi:hypothetical protein
VRGGLTRRTFVRNSVIASAGAALAFGADGRRRAAQAADPSTGGNAGPSKASIPRGRIGKLEISRLVLGGNLLNRYSHIRDLQYVGQLVNRYNTDEKILQTIALAESMGINTLSVFPNPPTRKLLKEYREKRGGKIQWITYWVEWIKDLAYYGRKVQEMVDDGADAVYIWGEDCDKLVKEGKIDVLARAVEMMKAHGIPVGVGAHALQTIQAVEKARIPCDFYMKTLHHLDYPSAKMDFDSVFCRQPRETIEFMKTVEKPWIAFKVMAGGAIPPKNAFQYAIEGGADFIFAGMFDFEIAADVKIMNEVLTGSPKRARPWRS